MLAQLPAQALLLSPVVLCELEFGIAKSQRPETTRAALAILLLALTFGGAIARTYPQIVLSSSRR